MRIVHLTDLHVQARPALHELSPKRWLGSANLYALGRRHHFNPGVQRAAIDGALAQKPELVVVTGDLTAQGLPRELEAAHTLLDRLAKEVELVIIPGNHDTYVKEPAPGHAMRQVLGEWMPPATPSVVRHGSVALLHLETCHATLWSEGHLELSHLSRADALLAELPEGTFTFLLQHYPLLNRHGELYGPARRALPQAPDVIAWIRRQGAISAVLHGHEHHGFRTAIDTPRGAVPILNPGASGYAWLPRKHRTAHFNVYTVQDGILTNIERCTFDGSAFAPEPGGAYATGR